MGKADELRALLGIRRDQTYTEAALAMYGDEQGRLPEAQAVKLISGVEVRAQEERWTFEIVKAQLREMAHGIERIAGKVAPDTDKGFWPELKKGFSDLVNMLGDDPRTGLPVRTYDDWARGQNFSRPPVEITRMETALLWMMKYVPKDKFPDENTALQVWIWCVAKRRKFSLAVSEMKCGRSTAYERRDRAIRIILAGLVRDGVEP